MRFRRLRYFVAVADELSFTRAAERLHMAQPPLSQQIALLEKDLGATLFDRSRRAVRLTAAGAALLPEARRLLADLDDTARLVRRVADGSLGRLSVGFVPSAINGALSDLLRGFRAGHPDVELTLRERDPDALLRSVRDRSLDLAVLYLPAPEPDLDHRWLGSEELLLALPAHHPAAARSRVALTDVADEPFVLPEQHDVPGLHAAVGAAFADAGVTPRVAQRGVWLMQTVLGLVAAGIGLAVVPSSVAALDRAGVVLRHLDGAARRVDLAAVWRPDNPSAPLARMLSGTDRPAGRPSGGSGPPA
ncbi:LysR family transcriptional regulator [Pseudonocardia petroleophila]|uniref:LysR family transcriptional regulator n=1 Tax=Pseudonocardia petroleophila TaxID=37331 RepID=A0A7G7MCS1_9PSEU|nr:LysR substrate-binding domain-containing protein [Pseudonocardia petroleophila]QNG50582.1 LysR family transcriptional regulator [Pseudonocardia petroleophila]